MKIGALNGVLIGIELAERKKMDGRKLGVTLFCAGKVKRHFKTFKCKWFDFVLKNSSILISEK